MKHLAATILCSTLLLTSCKKEEMMPAVPEIALISVSPLEVVQFGERVKVRFSYQDGNGDLGHPDPDVPSLEVKEARLNAPDWYHIPPIAPEGSEVMIRGELEVELNALFLLGNGTVETTTYTLRIRDRAGNWSNTITTPTITIVQGD
jgi:hypothetical protein